MKKIALALSVMLSIAAAPVFAQSGIKSIEIGTKASGADKELKNANGASTSLNKAATARGLIVMFSCNTCPYVIKSQARTKEVMKYAQEKGIGMVIINSNEAQRDEADSYNAMVKYAKTQGYKVPYLVDEHSELADMYGATHTPEVFLFNGNKELVYKGAMEDNPSDPASSKQMFLKNAINNMLAKKAIDPNSTKSIGCSIKRNS